MAAVKEFTLPDLGEGLTEAEIVRWLVEVGEVVAVGSAVTRFRVGERVASTFFRAWIDGPPPRGPLLALGAPPDLDLGCLHAALRTAR